MANDRDLLAARIILGAMLPVVKVVVADDPKMAARFAGVNAKIGFSANNGENETIGACIVFTDGMPEIVQGQCEDPDIGFSFGTVKKMNAFFAGKLVLPRIKGFFRIMLLIKALALMMSLKILMPNIRPKDMDKQRLKVKMAFYMITTALSQYNKGGDPEMTAWTKKQPERIYQISVDPKIAAYLRVKAGKSKAGRGEYKKRRPFVHMKFNGVEGAFPVVMNDVDMVTAMRKGYLMVEGSPEYARDMGDFMVKIQDMIL
ncbi:hypothetical protein QUF76_08005 [Desulfobacterales bacterium HSG16]|nr:hypothetical protein [Desulfobacterales bacterium HSG16]